MTTLYCCAIQSNSDLEAVFRATTALDAAYPDLSTNSQATDLGQGLYLKTEMGECLLQGRLASSQEQLAFAALGAVESIVEFSVPERTPDNTALSWDSLVTAARSVRCIVWLGVDTYGPDSILSVAPIRTATLPGIGSGHLLTAEELIRFAEE
jgi:hypothetical protein